MLAVCGIVVFEIKRSDKSELIGDKNDWDIFKRNGKYKALR